MALTHDGRRGERFPTILGAQLAETAVRSASVRPL
jgi:hypothetical protein